MTDNGPGIPNDLRARIFRAFFTTKGPEKGTGLGLALSRSIARDHGGDLVLDGGSEGGARFVVRLPGLIVSAKSGMTSGRRPPSERLNEQSRERG